MKKIAYIELDTHAEIAGNFMELMSDSQVFSVDYYFSEKILKQLQCNVSGNIFRSNSNQILEQLSQKKYDLVIIGTAHRFFNTFQNIVDRFNTSIIVHNLNFTKLSRLHLFQNIFKEDVVYRLKLLLKEGLLQMPNVYSKAKNLLVLDKNIIEFDLSLNHSKTRFLKFLPIFYNKFSKPTDNKFITIVIPGAVSQKRRDYNFILKELNEFRSKENSTQKLEIVFLGKAEGLELNWLQEFEKLKSDKISIQYFTEKVPQNIFDKWMNKADLLWCPIRSDTEFFSNPEFYGKSKMTGNIGDAIKYGKTALFPKGFKSNYSFFINSEDDVMHQIFNFANDSLDFKCNYSKEHISVELHQVIRSLI